MDFQIKEFQSPIIVTNYEEVSKSLSEWLENYKGLVVTEETLPGCRKALAELSAMRRKIEECRKTKKKELEMPIKGFDKQCKDLASQITEIEKPIKDGIQIHTDKEKEKKRKEAVEIIKKTAKDFELEGKFKEELTVLDKYTNLSISKKAVREDIETRAFALKVAQDKEKDCLETIKTVLDSENNRLTAKMEISDFQHLIDSGFSTAIIIDEIKKRADRIYKQENEVKESEIIPTQPDLPVEESKPEPVIETVEEKERLPEQQYSATYKIIGSVEQLRSVSAFLRERGIAYTVLDQRTI